MKSEFFAEALYIERLCQLVLVPVDKAVPNFSASGVYPLEKAQELLDRLGLDIPIKIDDRLY